MEINEEYMGSGEDDFYRSRQKELQAFVDSLPDYSFLSALGFIVYIYPFGHFWGYRGTTVVGGGWGGGEGYGKECCCGVRFRG